MLFSNVIQISLHFAFFVCRVVLTNKFKNIFKNPFVKKSPFERLFEFVDLKNLVSPKHKWT